jgi:hypothetical protein
MKRKIQLSKGLSINKEAIAKLQESQMAQLRGGVRQLDESCAGFSCNTSCKSGSCNSKTTEEIS